MSFCKKHSLQRHLKVSHLLTKQRERIFIAIGKVKYKKDLRDLRIILKYLDEARSVLDSEYHEIITDEEFRELGHIYYKSKVDRTNYVF